MKMLIICFPIVVALSSCGNKKDAVISAPAGPPAKIEQSQGVPVSLQKILDERQILIEDYNATISRLRAAGYGFQFDQLALIFLSSAKLSPEVTSGRNELAEYAAECAIAEIERNLEKNKIEERWKIKPNAKVLADWAAKLGSDQAFAFAYLVSGEDQFLGKISDSSTGSLALYAKASKLAKKPDELKDFLMAQEATSPDNSYASLKLAEFYIQQKNMPQAYEALLGAAKINQIVDPAVEVKELAITFLKETTSLTEVEIAAHSVNMHTKVVPGYSLIQSELLALRTYAGAQIKNNEITQAADTLAVAMAIAQINDQSLNVAEQAIAIQNQTELLKDFGDYISPDSLTVSRNDWLNQLNGEATKLADLSKYKQQILFSYQNGVATEDFIAFLSLSKTLGETAALEELSQKK